MQRPDSAKVLIETLWDYQKVFTNNAHDKIEVDTGLTQIGQSAPNVMQNFKLSVKPRFKNNFVAPNGARQLDLHRLWPNRGTGYHLFKKKIGSDKLPSILSESQKQEKKAVSVMWFVDVKGAKALFSRGTTSHLIFALVNKSARSRGKTPFDRSLVIRQVQT